MSSWIYLQTLDQFDLGLKASMGKLEKPGTPANSSAPRVLGAYTCLARGRCYGAALNLTPSAVVPALLGSCTAHTALPGRKTRASVLTPVCKKCDLSQKQAAGLRREIMSHGFGGSDLGAGSEVGVRWLVGKRAAEERHSPSLLVRIPRKLPPRRRPAPPFPTAVCQGAVGVRAGRRCRSGSLPRGPHHQGSGFPGGGAAALARDCRAGAGRQGVRGPRAPAAGLSARSRRRARRRGSRKEPWAGSRCPPRHHRCRGLGECPFHPPPRVSRSGLRRRGPFSSHRPLPLPRSGTGDRGGEVSASAAAPRSGASQVREGGGAERPGLGTRRQGRGELWERSCRSRRAPCRRLPGPPGSARAQAPAPAPHRAMGSCSAAAADERSRAPKAGAGGGWLTE